MKQTFFFPSADGKTQIRVIEWIPDGEVRAVLQICHGMAEHILRYDRFATAMNAAGIYVVGNDHLGHGESVSEDALHGFFKHPDGNVCLLSDIHTLRMRTQEKYPDVPFFLLGHSMGSFLTRQYLAMHGEGLAGAIVMGTGLQASATLSVARGLCRVIAVFCGRKHHSLLVNLLAFSSNNHRIKHPRTVFDWLTKDESMVDRYIEDPWCGFLFTVNGFDQMFYSIGLAQKKETFEAAPQSCPILLVSGAEDPIGHYGADVQKIYDTYKAAGKSVQMKLYPEDRHEILNETDRLTVDDDLKQFILAHC